MSLWTRKPIGLLQAEAAGEEIDESPGLRRSLGTLGIAALGIGAVAGASVFILTGIAAARYAGPATVYSFLLAGAGALLIALCYSEFAAMIPSAGGAYAYAYATLGELVAWLTGWMLVLAYTLGAGGLARAWSTYFTGAARDFGLLLPPRLTQDPFVIADGGLAVTGAVANLPALFLIGVVTALLLLGLRAATRINTLLVMVNIAIVLVVILVGFFHVDQANWHPFLPTPDTPGDFAWSGVVRGAALIFLAFAAFEAVATAAREARKPHRDMPVGILGSIALGTVLCVLMTLVLTGLVHYARLDVAVPFAVALVQAGQSLAWLAPVAKGGALIGVASALLVLLVALPRVLFAMARDGLLPASLGQVSPRFRAPHVATAFAGIVSALLVGLLPAAVAWELASASVLVAFVIVAAGILVLRYREPNLPRPFRLRGAPLVPVMAVAVCGYLMASIPATTWLRLSLWLVAGLLVYFAYGRTHSRLRRSDTHV